MTMTKTYTWRTDAAWGEIDAPSLEGAVALLVARDEWPTERHIADGSWAFVRDEETGEEIDVGTVP